MAANSGFTASSSIAHELAPVVDALLIRAASCAVLQSLL